MPFITKKAKSTIVCIMTEGDIVLTNKRKRIVSGQWLTDKKKRRFARSQKCQQHVVDKLGQQTCPDYTPIKNHLEWLWPFQVFVALLVSQDLKDSLFWNDLKLENQKSQFYLILNWLMHPDFGFRVENILFDTYREKPALYKSFFSDGLSFFFPWYQYNKNVTHSLLPKVRHMYSKSTLARFIRLHLNLFNYPVVERAKKLGVLNPLMRTLIKLSREDGSYKYILACMDDWDFKIKPRKDKNFACHFVFRGLSVEDNQKINTRFDLEKTFDSLSFQLKLQFFGEKSRKKDDAWVKSFVKFAGVMLLGAAFFSQKRADMHHQAPSVAWPVAVMVLPGVTLPGQQQNPGQQLIPQRGGPAGPLRSLPGSSGLGSSSGSFVNARQDLTDKTRIPVSRVARRLPRKLTTAPVAQTFEPFVADRDATTFINNAVVISYNSEKPNDAFYVHTVNSSFGTVTEPFLPQEKEVYDYTKKNYEKTAKSIPAQIIGYCPHGDKAVEYVNTLTRVSAETNTHPDKLTHNLHKHLIFVDRANKIGTQAMITTTYDKKDEFSSKMQAYVTQALRKFGYANALDLVPHDLGHAGPALVAASFGIDHDCAVVVSVPKKYNGPAGWDYEKFWLEFIYQNWHWTNFWELFEDKLDEIETMYYERKYKDVHGIMTSEQFIDALFFKKFLVRQRTLVKYYKLEAQNKISGFFPSLATEYKKHYTDFFMMPVFQLNHITARLKSMAEGIVSESAKTHSTMAANYKPEQTESMSLKKTAPETLSKLVGSMVESQYIFKKQINTCYELLSFVIDIHSAMVGHSEAENASLRTAVRDSLCSSTLGCKPYAGSTQLDQDFFVFLKNQLGGIEHHLHNLHFQQISAVESFERQIRVMENDPGISQNSVASIKAELETAKNLIRDLLKMQDFSSVDSVKGLLGPHQPKQYYIAGDTDTGWAKNTVKLALEGELAPDAVFDLDMRDAKTDAFHNACVTHSKERFDGLMTTLQEINSNFKNQTKTYAAFSSLFANTLSRTATSYSTSSLAVPPTAASTSRQIPTGSSPRNPDAALYNRQALITRDRTNLPR
jgi:hypothetical protein